MLFDVSRKVLAGVVLAGSWVALTAAGCSSSSSPATPQADASAVCPVDPTKAPGASCSQEGLRCGPEYLCGFIQTPLLCICTEGKFNCVDGQGNQLNPGDTPQCPMPGKNNPACPANETAANLAPCTTAQTGMQCAYAPTCMGGTLTYDLCTCENGQTKGGGYGLAFQCENSCGSVVSDAGTGDTGGPPPVDSGAPPDTGAGGMDAAGE